MQGARLWWAAVVLLGLPAFGDDSNRAITERNVAFSNRQETSNSTRVYAKEANIVFNWHAAKSWKPYGSMASGDAKDKHGRPRCHSIACKWHRIHPDVVRVHGHAKWHPLKKQLEDEEGNERLPIGVALGMLGNLCAVGIPLLLWYLWSKKSSKMLHTFRSFLRMKTLMVEQPGMNGKASYKKASNAGSGKLVDPTAALAQEQIAARGHLFAAVCVVSILQGIEVAALAAFFPPAALKKGVSETMAGIIFAMRPCVQVILSPVAGRLMKNVTNQGFILVGGMGLLALVYVLFGLVENVLSGFAFTFVCFVAALIQGTVDALVNTAAFDIILALYPSEVPYRIAMKEVYDTVGYLVGTPLGGALYEAGGFMLPFTILGIGILLSSAGLYVITPSTGSHQPGSTEPDPMLDNPLKFYASFLSRRMALILAAGTVLSGASYPFLETTLTLHAQQLQLNTSFVGLLFSICNGAFLITMAAIGGHHRSGLGVGCAGLIGCALSFFLIGPTPVIPILPLSTSALTIAMVFCGVGTALAWLPMMHLLIVHLQRGNGRGNAANAAIAGVASAATSMGIVLGSFLGGLLADSFGFCWATTIWAMLFILFFIVMQTEDHRRYELHTHNGY